MNSFTYTGRLFKNRQGYAFVEAIGQLVEEDPTLKDKLRIDIMGSIAQEIRRRYQELFDQYHIEQMFYLPGDVSYQKAMQAQVDTDYLLLIVDTGETSSGVIPGKLFEYVASRRPIFALVDPGATQEIVEKAGLGVVVPAKSVDACREALREWLSKPAPEQWKGDEDYLQQFDRRVISERFAELLDRMVESARNL